MDLKKFLKSIILKFKKNNKINSFSIPSISDDAILTASSIRGDVYNPAILIQGVMPRCGSNYISKLIGYHPNIHSLPKGINEFPILRHVEELISLQKKFFESYPHNKECFGEMDFLPLFGTSLMKHILRFSEKDKIALLKTPHVENLHLFFTLFPFEKLIIVLRDGRDVVSSSIKTWPGKNTFKNWCKQWSDKTNTILSFDEFYKEKNNQSYLLIRYEDVVDNPNTFVDLICKKFNLNRNEYPFDKINKVPVIGSSDLLKNGKVTWKGIDKPKGFNPIGRWSSWKKNQKETFKKYAGDALIKAGYCKDFNWINN